MRGKVSRAVEVAPARPKSRDDTPTEARRKAEAWIRSHFERQGLEIAAIGMHVVKGPIVRFVAQTREPGARSFTGTLDVLRGRVENVSVDAG